MITESSTIASLIEDFLEYLVVERACSNNTLVSYRNDLNQFDEHVNLTDVNQITSRHIDKYVKYLSHKGYLSTTKGRKLASVRSFVSYLHSEGFIENDPTELIPTPKRSQRLPKVLKLSDVKKLLQLPLHISSSQMQCEMLLCCK